MGFDRPFLYYFELEILNAIEKSNHCKQNGHILIITNKIKVSKRSDNSFDSVFEWAYSSKKINLELHFESKFLILTFIL